MVFLWVSLYGLTYTVSGTIAQHLHMKPVVIPAAMLLYTAGFVFWIFRTGRDREIRLCRTSICALKDNLFFLPLASLPVYNLMTSQFLPAHLPTLALMLAVSVCEEIFFRGFLLVWLERKNTILAVVASSVLFAFFHCVNIASVGSFYVAIQVLCAFSAGICYSLTVIRGKSLLIPMIAHFLTNVTATAEISSVDIEQSVPGLCVCMCIYLGYGIWLSHKIKETRR